MISRRLISLCSCCLFAAALSRAQQVIISENFNACALPGGWETQTLTGNAGWRLGLLDSTSAVFSVSNSMDGTCFAYFDDNALGNGAPYSTVRLASPWFNGGQYAAFELQFDLVFPLDGDRLRVLVEHGDGETYTVLTYAWWVGGPAFDIYQNCTLDLSPYRHLQMRVVFEYSDGNGTGLWAGIDNVVVRGDGQAADICNNAVALTTGAPCNTASTVAAIFAGPPAACSGQSVGGLWYRWTADFNGLARIQTGADFNDAVSVFTGDCSNPQLLRCYNKDEHGFSGETVYFQAQTGVQYFIRVSGDAAGFGSPRGNLCVNIAPVNVIPAPPPNDNCSTATELVLQLPCLNGTNRNAHTSPILPSLNQLARADVWYRFTAPAVQPGQKPAVRSNADFSDIITLYRGVCDQLEELAGNHLGNLLILPALVPGETYYVQISGSFATVEGGLCPELMLLADTPPVNEDCTGAILVLVDGNCSTATLEGSRPSGYVPPCAISFGSDVWFRFTAPAGGAVKINSGVQFEHFLTVWQGENCDSLKAVFCAENPQRCAGYLEVEDLTPGNAYYIQIASRYDLSPYLVSGEVCLTVLNKQTAAPFEVLQLDVTEECNSPQTGVIEIHIQGGIPPYELLGAQNGQEFLSGASYAVSVRDAVGCETSVTRNMRACIDAGCFLQATLTDVQPKCHDAADGSITVQTLLGTAPYTFQWSNGSTAPALYNIPAGTYTVTVTDVVGCEATATQTLANPDPILISVMDIVQPNTGLSNGLIQLIVSGGTGALTLRWDRDGNLLQDTAALLTGLSGGLYSLLVTDANGCMMQFDTVLTETVSTHSSSSDDQAVLFPNPASTMMTLRLNFSSLEEIDLRITDASGRSIRQWSAGRMQRGAVEIGVQDMAQGQYQLLITAGRETLARSFSVKRN
jgi:hypothetical protein